MVLKNRNVDTSKVQEVAKLCGAAWKQMSEQERQPYQEKYMQDKKRYLSEVEPFSSVHLILDTVFYLIIFWGSLNIPFWG